MAGTTVATGDSVASAIEHAVDRAKRLRRRRLDEIVATMREMPEAEAVEILDVDEFRPAPLVLAALPEDQAQHLLEAMSSDRAADALRRMPAAARQRLLAGLTPESRTAVDSILSYPEDTAGSLMTSEFVSVPADATVAEVMAHVRSVEYSRETIYAIYLLDGDSQRLVGAVSLRRLIMAEPQLPVRSVAERRQLITAPPEAGREEVAHLISNYDLLAIPVVDPGNRMLGIVTADDMMTAMIEEQSEDIQKLGGAEALDQPYWESSLLDIVKKRVGWLAFLFISGMLTATAMEYFDEQIERAVVLAVFVPLVISSGGNSGSQATSLMIRSLALEEVRLADWFRVFLREAPAGLILGVVLCVIGFLRVAVWQVFGWQDYGAHWFLLALAIGLSLLCIVAYGSLVGSMLPFALRRLGFDPATASAPLIATLVDVSGIVIYFSVAYAILRGTLL
jgi:magnesium transporter